MRQRRSIFCGILLIVIGVLFLVHRHMPGVGIGHLLVRYWPVLLILWGLARLYDHFAARRAGERKPPALSGGEIALLFLLLVVVAGMLGFDWAKHQNPNLDFTRGWFARTATAAREASIQSVKPGAKVTVATERGNIVVFGDQSDTIRVVANTTATASRENEAEKLAAETRVQIEPVGNGYEVRPSIVGGRARVDLEIHMPKQASLVAKTQRGNIRISDLTGTVTAATQKGDVEIRDVGSSVDVQLRRGDARIMGTDGDVRISGSGSEVDLHDIGGTATIEGEFFGPIRIRNVSKTLRYASSRTDLTVVRLSGRLEMDSGRLEVSDVPGSLKLVTRSKDVLLENVAGRIDISNRDGDVQVRFAQAPRAEVSITNDSGNLDLVLPPKSNFEIDAQSRSGKVRSDFEGPSLKLTESDELSKLEGRYGGIGPQISLVTSYGTIALRKAA